MAHVLETGARIVLFVGLVYQGVHPTAGRSTAPFDTAIPAKERDKIPG